MNAKWIACIASIALFPLLGGCCNCLVYVHTMDIGVDMSTSPTNGTAMLVVGYDRRTFASVPRKSGLPSNDAMALVAVDHTHLQGIDSMRVSHAVATGQPAVNLAQNPADLQIVEQKILGNCGGQP